MTYILAFVFGGGVFSIVSCFLWPRAASHHSHAARPQSFRRLRDHIARAGIPQLSPRILIVVSVLVALISAALTAALVPVAAIVAAVAIFAFLAPTAAIVLRGSARFRATRIAWPDVVDHLVSATRAGLPLPDGIVALARSGSPSLQPAFAGFALDYRASGNFTECLDRLKDVLRDPIADRIVETLKMSREVGGNELPALLRNLAIHLRQEAAIRSEIEARQSWTVNAARLGVVAPWVVLLLLATRPEAAAAYNTPGGTVIIIAGAAVSAGAYRVMLAIGRLPVEQRWFR